MQDATRPVVVATHAPKPGGSAGSGATSPRAGACGRLGGAARSVGPRPLWSRPGGSWPAGRIEVVQMLLVEPGTDAPLSLQLKSSRPLPAQSFIRIRGLPPAASLSEGHFVRPGVWAVPLSSLATGRITVPAAQAGRSELTVSLVARRQHRHRRGQDHPGGGRRLAVSARRSRRPGHGRDGGRGDRGRRPRGDPAHEGRRLRAEGPPQGLRRRALHHREQGVRHHDARCRQHGLHRRRAAPAASRPPRRSPPPRRVPDRAPPPCAPRSSASTAPRRSAGSSCRP